MADRRDAHPVVVELTLLRQREGLSVQAAARQAGLGRSSVYQWESGEHVPSLASLDVWAKSLGKRLALVDDGGEG